MYTEEINKTMILFKADNMLQKILKRSGVLLMMLEEDRGIEKEIGPIVLLVPHFFIGCTFFIGPIF